MLSVRKGKSPSSCPPCFFFLSPTYTLMEGLHITSFLFSYPWPGKPSCLLPNEACLVASMKATLTGT